MSYISRVSRRDCSRQWQRILLPVVSITFQHLQNYRMLIDTSSSNLLSKNDIRENFRTVKEAV